MGLIPNLLIAPSPGLSASSAPIIVVAVAVWLLIDIDKPELSLLRHFDFCARSEQTAALDRRAADIALDVCGGIANPMA